MSDRKNAITKMLLNVKYPTENELKEAVESFSKSNLSLTEIESLARSLTAQPDNINGNRPRAGVF